MVEKLVLYDLTTLFDIVYIVYHHCIYLLWTLYQYCLKILC